MNIYTLADNGWGEKELIDNPLSDKRWAEIKRIMDQANDTLMFGQEAKSEVNAGHEADHKRST